MNESPPPQHYSPLRQLVLARLREFLRRPSAIFWVYVFPLVMMTSLGIAFRNRPVEVIRVAIVESSGAERLLEGLSDDEHFSAHVLPEEEARRLMRIGRIEVIVAIPASDSNLYEYIYDPTNPRGLLARNMVNNQLQVAAGRREVVATRDRTVTEPGGRYVDFLVPGLLGLGLMGGGLWGVGFAIVDMRIRNLLKRFLATPMRRTDFLLAVMLSRFLFTVPEVLLLLLVAWALFGVVIHGNLLVVMLLIVLGAFQFAGIGLLVASRARTMEAVSGLINLTMLPMWITSGVFFSYERFPDYVQPLIRILPLTALIDALRSVIQEGAGLTAIGSELIIIVAWGLSTFFIALRIFRWN